MGLDVAMRSDPVLHARDLVEVALNGLRAARTVYPGLLPVGDRMASTVRVVGSAPPSCWVDFAGFADEIRRILVPFGTVDVEIRTAGTGVTPDACARQISVVLQRLRFQIIALEPGTDSVRAAAQRGDAVAPPAAKPEELPPDHVVWYSPLLDLSGYAAVGRNVIEALDQSGTRVRAEPVFAGLGSPDGT